jgi:hypothetical protein
MNSDIFIIICVAIALIFLVYIFVFKKTDKQKKFSNWLINDCLMLKEKTPEYDLLQKNGYNYALLKGWSEEAFYVSFDNNETGIITRCEWSVLQLNKSAYWRRNYEECVRDMGGIQPAFNPKIGNVKNDKTNESNEDLNVELFNETQCQVYLKKAIDEENFELAARIRKRMEYFR